MDRDDINPKKIGATINLVEKFVDINELVKLKLKQRNIKFEIKPEVNKKIIKTWSNKCEKKLSKFCQEALTRLLNKYMESSVESFLNQIMVLNKGLRIEVALALALTGDESLINKYIVEGSVDWELVTNIINSTIGSKYDPSDIKKILHVS